MRILLLSQWFTPEPIFKGLPFAKALRDRGHDVQVLTGFPNYPEGKLYAGYRQRVLATETMEGIPVLRVPLYPSHDASPVRRAANYASFAFSSAAIGVFAVKPADVMYVYHPPATVAFPALTIGKLRRIPFVYDIQDLWPDTLEATGMANNAFIMKMMDRWCRWTYRLASRIVVLSPGFKATLVERGVPHDKIDVIYNWCDEGQIVAGPREEVLSRESGLAGRFNVVFAGTMGKVQALDAVLDAAEVVAVNRPRVQFVFMGGGIDVGRLRQMAERKRIPNVRFLSRRPFSEVGGILKIADVLLVHLKDDPLFRVTIPSKIQTYLAIGRPVLAAVRGDAADLVRKANAGLCCAPEDPKAIAKTVEELFDMPKARLEEMGENGRRYYRQEMSLAAGVDRFEGVFRAAVASN
jgi:colanic acid biosynthesis glycosyl transferase WcaI